MHSSTFFFKPIGRRCNRPSSHYHNNSQSTTILYIWLSSHHFSPLSLDFKLAVPVTTRPLYNSCLSSGKQSRPFFTEGKFLLLLFPTCFYTTDFFAWELGVLLLSLLLMVVSLFPATAVNICAPLILNRYLSVFIFVCLLISHIIGTRAAPKEHVHLLFTQSLPLSQSVWLAVVFFIVVLISANFAVEYIAAVQRIEATVTKTLRYHVCDQALARLCV